MSIEKLKLKNHVVAGNNTHWMLFLTKKKKNPNCSYFKMSTFLINISYLEFFLLWGIPISRCSHICD